MSDQVFRIHPSVGFARVGTSEEYNLAPETLAGHPVDGSDTTGGLPIKPGTEDTPIEASDVRDAQGALKRQAARFKIFQYTAESPETYPMGETGEEIRIGSKVTVDGATKTVKDIIWTVHMANKKTAWYESADDEGIVAWKDGKTPPLRNTDLEPPPSPPISDDPNDPARLARLIIDPGPRTIRGASAGPVGCDIATPASYWQSGDQPTEIPDYPKTFPQDGFSELNPPGTEKITTLGDLCTDDSGRLIVAGAYGRANSFNKEPAQYGFDNSVNNDWWFDDTGDGPVTAALVFDDGSTLAVEGGAWVVSTDPSYAPQILNVVSLWEDIYDSWVRKLDLRPDLFSDGKFNESYTPSFRDEVQPIFWSAGLQRWITNLNTLGTSAHERVSEITADTDPATTQLHGLGLIREPVDPDNLSEGVPVSGDDRRMPLSLGDAGRSLLSLSFTQYFYLERWDAGAAKGPKIELNHGETLDKASFSAGLGGRFGPGIDMTYICREPDLYIEDWQTSATGPFRINPKPLDYCQAGSAPFLSLGWIPRRASGREGVEPGDICKFMAIPWHADYNSCATHLPAPNPEFNNTLYWSWPAQRPVAIYKASEVVDGKTLPDQRFSVRGPGTKTELEKGQSPPPFGPNDPAEVGRFQETQDAAKEPGIIRILDHWMNIGTVIQATRIDDGTDYDPSLYLEVASKLDDADSDSVQPWPNTVPPDSISVDDE